MTGYFAPASELNSILSRGFFTSTWGNVDTLGVPFYRGGVRLRDIVTGLVPITQGAKYVTRLDPGFV